MANKLLEDGLFIIKCKKENLALKISTQTAQNNKESELLNQWESWFEEAIKLDSNTNARY
jgi:hypothetical protein